MYKVLSIGGEDYKFEFSIEASLYSDCVQKITDIMVDVNSGESNADIKKVLSAFADVPSAAVTCFFAGLLEHHGSEADGKVPNFKTAKKLAVQLIRDENSGVKNWYDLFTLCTEQMAEDGFFELIGLNDMLQIETEPTPTVIPQDHKRKQRTKASEK